MNETFLVIGKIEMVQLEEDFISPDSFIDLSLADSLCCNGADSYYLTKPAGRYQYAKPGNKPQKIGE